MTTLPGFTISVLRQRTFTARGEPLLISGRVTAFGIGLPAFVRVYLEGPQHNPEIRAFDTLAAPITGDYSVSVLAEEDGQYQVYAQAFPAIALPLLGAPEPIFLGPPLAESPRPPISVGRPVNGRVEQELAPGRVERVPVPPSVEVEIRAPVTVAPRIEVLFPGFPAPRPAPAAAPPEVARPPVITTVVTAPPAAPAPAPAALTPTRASARIIGVEVL